MKKLLLIVSALVLISSHAKATIHVVQVWDGYLQFLQPESPFIVELGDTIQWLPFDQPFMIHTVTSTDIPDGAMTFDYTWQAPADTFFQYVPTVLGSYDYECTPHAPGMSGRFTVIDGTTGIGESSSENGNIQVFPNPAADQLFIDLSGFETNEVTVHVMDHSGRRLDVLYREAIRSENRTIVESVAHLPAGVYYLLVESDGMRRTQRWVKL